MKAVLVRASKANVCLKDNARELAHIKNGIVVFVGIDKNDNDTKNEEMAEKITNLRIFDDENGKLKYSLIDKKYEILCVPNFTLCANIDKGRRPSFENAMPIDAASNLFENFVLLLRARQIPVKSGEFAKSMYINIECDGPVNITIEI